MAGRVLSISQAASVIGRAADTIRDWDRDGRLVASRNELGQRVYTEKQVAEGIKIAQAIDAAKSNGRRPI